MDHPDSVASPSRDSLSMRIRELANLYFDDTVAIRRHLHQHPELSFHEFETAKFVGDKLEEYGFAVRRGVAETGVVGELNGALPGPTVLLRADIDALPILERTNLAFASNNDGVMHACGHDIHTAGLLCVARILAELRDELAGTVRLAFQPAEEHVPGGALGMIRDGVLENPKPDAVFGLHTWPPMATGTIAVRPGMFMASNDEIEITVHGEGGHAAAPHLLSADPVLVASQLVVALQSIVSRNCPPNVPSVLSFGSVHADGASNVIPDTVRLLGTLRCMDEVWRKEAKRRIHQVVENVTAAFGARADLTIIDGYPLLRNDDQMAAFVRDEGTRFLGGSKSSEAPLWFAAEDFAYYLQEIPGAFFLLGVNREETEVTGLHTNTYDPNEDALRTGSSFMAHLALRYCSQFQSA